MMTVTHDDNVNWQQLLIEKFKGKQKMSELEFTKLPTTILN
jgi:hypothetical protein